MHVFACKYISVGGGVHMYMHACNACMYVCTHRLGVDISCLPLSLSFLVFSFLWVGGTDSLLESQA